MMFLGKAAKKPKHFNDFKRLKLAADAEIAAIYAVGLANIRNCHFLHSRSELLCFVVSTASGHHFADKNLRSAENCPKKPIKI